jgi:hypothetical protein
MQDMSNTQQDALHLRLGKDGCRPGGPISAGEGRGRAGSKGRPAGGITVLLHGNYGITQEIYRIMYVLVGIDVCGMMLVYYYVLRIIVSYYVSFLARSG